MAAIDEVTGTIDKPTIRAYGEVRKGFTHFAEGDVLLAKITPCMENGKCAIASKLINRLGFGTTELHVLRPYEGILADFVYYYLRQKSFRAEAAMNMTGTAGQLRVPSAYIERVKIPLCSTNEQKRIVKKIRDFTQRARSAAPRLQRIPPLMRKFRQSVLAKAFRGELSERDPSDEPASILLERVRQEHRKKWEKDLRDKGKDPKNYKHEDSELVDIEGPYRLPESWTWTTIGAVETFIGSGITPLGGQNVYVSDGIPFIRSQNVYPDGLHLDAVVHVTPRMHAEMRRSHVSPGDVLLNITGASIGRSTYIPAYFGEANVNQHVCIIRTGPWIVPAYLSSFLNSPIGQDQIFAIESGVTREGLNYGQIRQLKFPIAPLNEQKQIAKRVSEIFNKTNLATNAALEATKRTDSLEQSILLSAFQGRLVPQEPNEEPVSILLDRINTVRTSVGKKGNPKRFKK
jgi:type I restriction enzyme S subunit